MAWHAKLIAGACLVAINTASGVLYRVAQRRGHGFHFNTNAAVCLAECVKFGMSMSFLLADNQIQKQGHSRFQSVWGVVRSEMSLGAFLKIWFLALIYSAGNQLGINLFLRVDPGSIYIFKACSTATVATIQCIFSGKRFSCEQWKAMGMQFLALVVVQYNPCTSSGLYSPTAYLLLSAAAACSATTAAYNEHLVKNYSISLNVVNLTLYSGGILFNFLAYLFVPNPNSAVANLGFFDGFDDPYAICVVLSNSLLGLAITAVYKYADAITKCIATDITAAGLCVISVLFFGLKSTPTMWCGVLLVCGTVHAYVVAPTVPQVPAPQAKEDALKSTAPSPDNVGARELDTIDGVDDDDEESQLIRARGKDAASMLEGR